ncbi:class I SAM-dependent methyltransferase [Bounagaea algeriensis]
MTTERVDLRGAAATLLVMLYMRARDARSPHPILGDRYAADVLERIDYDSARLRLVAAGDAPVICARARCLDAWTEQFLAEHPHGQVLHLGCGLDSRPLRVARPDSARWVDVDYPDVIELRRRLYDLPSSVEEIPSSVTDPCWWDRVARDRPTLVLAEGVLMYLHPQQVHALLEQAVSTLTSGRIAFDTVAPWTARAAELTSRVLPQDIRFHWTYRQQEFAARRPELRRCDDRSAAALATGSVHDPLLRAIFRAYTAVPTFRDAMRLHRFTFGAGSGG